VSGVGPHSTKGVLFDMDGVLVASEDLKARAHAETVGRYGGRLEPAYYSEVMGQSHEAAALAFTEASGADLEPETYARVFRSIYGNLLSSGVELMPGAQPLLEGVVKAGFRIAVVSSSLRWMMDEVLARTGLETFFAVSISANDVGNEKPSPEPYLKALSELHLRPNDAVILEDSEAGVASGANAGVPVLAVRHRYNAKHDMTRAFAELDGLTDTRVVLDLIERAFAG
jgi:HAD superfamily hydrolase (TIGR01509 family)